MIFATAISVLALDCTAISVLALGCEAISVLALDCTAISVLALGCEAISVLALGYTAISVWPMDSLAISNGLGTDSSKTLNFLAVDCENMFVSVSKHWCYKLQVVKMFLSV